MGFQYPSPQRGDLVETHHGVDVADPYRWMEDPDSEETVSWVKEENAVFDNFMSKFTDTKSSLTESFTNAYNYEKYSVPRNVKGKYYFAHNSGLQNQAVLYVCDSLDGEPREFLDPNKLADDGTKSLGATRFSESGRYFAYAVQSSGSDWNTVFVKNCETGALLSDMVEWVKFSSISWLHDDSGFFYSRYPAPSSISEGADDEKRGTEVDSTQNCMLYFHAVGTAQSEDLLVYSFPENPKWMLGGEVSDDGKVLLITVGESCDPENRLFFASTENFAERVKAGTLEVTKAVDNFDASYDYITNVGSRYLFMSNKNAQRYRVLEMDLDDAATFAEPKDFIPEHPAAILNTVAASNGYLVVVYMEDVVDRMEIRSMDDGSLVRVVELPSVGQVVALRCKSDQEDLFYQFTGFIHPGTVIRVHTPTWESSVWKQSNVPGLDSSEFETKQVFYKSKDGTKVPMFLTSRKGQQPTGDVPTFLYGYGGFNISLQPGFSPFRLLFVKMFGGIYAVPGLRGGGEYGDSWHKAGTKERKQNVFDDFISAAEHLIAEGFTNPAKICINGGSNGGLLVCACLTQRPDLFGCAVSQVGVLDMLRFHKFTIGHAWCSDFGCADDEDGFKYLIKYSPVHNIRAPERGQWPWVLLTTADHDDRVSPLHSFKFAAEMQHSIGPSASQANPLLIRIECKAGHGAGKPTKKIIEEAVDIYTFISKALGV